MTLRCFFALELPMEVRHHVVTAINSLKRESGDAIRWVQPNAVHLTLHFLGNAVPAKLLQNLRGPAQTIADGMMPLTLTTEDVGQLPPAGPPRIIMMTCDGPGMAEVIGLHARLGSMLGARGLTIDARPWRPHVTLGRVKHRLPKPLPAIACQPRQFRVRGFTLFASTLTPGGPEYRTLEIFPFGPP